MRVASHFFLRKPHIKSKQIGAAQLYPLRGNNRSLAALQWSTIRPCEIIVSTVNTRNLLLPRPTMCHLLLYIDRCNNFINDTWTIYIPKLIVLSFNKSRTAQHGAAFSLSKYCEPIWSCCIEFIMWYEFSPKMQRNSFPSLIAYYVLDEPMYELTKAKGLWTLIRDWIRF